MPFFDQPMPPAMPGRPPYEHEVVKKWTAQTASSDGFVFVTPGCNHGPPAALKNSIDWFTRSGTGRLPPLRATAAPWVREPSSSFARRQSRFKFGRTSKARMWKKALPSGLSQRTS